MKKVLSRISKTVLLSTTLLLLVAPNFAPLFAQTAPTLTLSASPQVLITGSGDSSTITWQSNASGCTASGGWSGNKSASGNETVSPTVTTTYTLTCAGANNTQTTREVTVVVGAGDSTFSNYKHLFNTIGFANLKVGPNTSSFWFKSPIVNESEKTVPGLWFGFRFEFDPDSAEKGAEYSWDHIVAPDGSMQKLAFIVRVCDADTGENCIYHGIPYVEGIDSVRSVASSVTSFLSFFNPLTVVTSTQIRFSEMVKAHKNTLILYRKNSEGASLVNPLAGSGDYLNGGSFDIALQNGWFTISNPDSTNGSASPLSTPPDWVERTKTKPQRASLWYCASVVNGNGGTRQGPVPLPPFTAADTTNDPDIQRFGGACVDTVTGIKSSYFKIAEIDIPAIPSYEAAAQTQQEQTSEDPNSKNFERSVLPACGVKVAGIGSGTVLGCVARVIYHLIYNPIAWFAGIMGNLFDFFIGFSLDDSAYRQEFLVSGWRIVRDIANIFFIIILIWTGLATVFNIGGISMKRVVPQLIINAIIINFSLFATRTVIDISNISSRIFYHNINVHKVDKNTGTTMSATTPTTLGGYKAMSEVIVGSFNPQKLFRAKFLSPENALKAKSTVGTPSNVAGGAINAESDDSGSNLSANEYAGYFILITLIAAMLMFGVAMIFWKTAFLFLGRVIGLYISVIFSPFAFLTRENMPIVGNIPQISWKQWLGDLINYALMAPFFVFFLYIIWTFIKALPDFMKTNGGDGSFFQTVIEIAIPLLIVYFLIKQGVGIAQTYAGEVGGMVQQWTEKKAGFIGGTMLGVASAGTAVAGRNVLGRLGQRISRSQTLQNMSARGGVSGNIANRLMGVGQGMSRSSYDFRGTQNAQRLQQEFNLSGTNNRILGALNANQQQTSGGYQAAVQRETQRITRRAERFQLTGLQATQQNARNRAWENNYQQARNAAQQSALAQGQTFDEVNFRQSYVQQQTTAGNIRPQTAEEINRQREQNHNAALLRGTTLARISRTITNRGTASAGAVGAGQIAAGLSVLGGATLATGALIGEGSIQNEAQQTVANQRAAQARDPLPPGSPQRQALEQELNRLQGELTRITQRLNAIGARLQPPVPGNQLTQADLIDYRNNLGQDLVNIRNQINQTEDFIRNNQNNPAQAGWVNQARQRLQQQRGVEAQISTNIRESSSILNEYNRVTARIDGLRTQLGV